MIVGLFYSAQSASLHRHRSKLWSTDDNSTVARITSSEQCNFLDIQRYIHLRWMQINVCCHSFTFVSGQILRIWVGFVLWIRLEAAIEGFASVQLLQVLRGGKKKKKWCTTISRPIQLALKTSQDTAEPYSCTTDRSSVKYYMFLIYFA